MYRNAVYNSKERCINLFTWDESGKRVTYSVSHSPYLYVDDPKGEKVSIYGSTIKKKIFNNSYERYKFINESKIKRVYENLPAAQQYLIDTFWTKNEDKEFSKNPLKVVYLDIETYSPSSGGFPDVDNPTHPVTVITCYDSLERHFYTFGIKEYENTADNVSYVHCKNERELFIKFIEYLEQDYPDVISGWNILLFDMPYIVNRCERILGEESVKRMSPLNNVYFRLMKGKFGREQKRYYFDGISTIDYLDIYQRFCLKLRESYKLDAIAEIELGERKIDYGNIDLATLTDTNWQKLVEYNIQDVNILIKLEDKLQYISLLRMLSYVGLSTLESSMGTISVINGALAIKARRRGEVLSTFVRPDSAVKNPGAYVAEPKSGFKTNVVSFDANSLYPNVMISLNLSPETKIGRIEKTDKGNINIYHVTGKCFELTPKAFNDFLVAEKCAVTKAGFLFSQKKKGIIPEFLDHYYNERVVVKTELFKVKKQLKAIDDIIAADGTKRTELSQQRSEIQFEVERLNTKQMVIKTLLNSVYGYMGNKQAPIGDDDIASSVTLTGQAVIKQAGKLLQQYLTANYNITDEHTLDNSWVYSDTDSLYFSLQCINDVVPLKSGNMVSDVFYKELQTIEDFINKEINSWAIKSLRTIDSRFVFKRESISDVALFLQKKRYVMHILDDEGIKVDKFKYTGVEVVRTSMPNAIKPYAKKIIETMLLTQSLEQTNNILTETYNTFKDLPIEDVAFVMGLRGYEKYASKCNEFNIGTRTPIHVKSAYLHNFLNKKLGIENKYEEISSGDKTRYVYLQQPNKYGIDSIGFKYTFPEEYKSIFKINYEKMFEKILFSGIERFYQGVNWQIRKPSENVTCELFDLFGI